MKFLVLPEGLQRLHVSQMNCSDQRQTSFIEIYGDQIEQRGAENPVVISVLYPY